MRNQCGNEDWTLDRWVEAREGWGWGEKVGVMLPLLTPRPLDPLPRVWQVLLLYVNFNLFCAIETVKSCGNL